MNDAEFEALSDSADIVVSFSVFEHVIDRARGVKQAGVVLRYIAQARSRGLGVVFITHNPHHAYAVGDHFTILKRGRSTGTFEKSDISREEVVRLMSGADELDELSHELQEFARTDARRSVRLNSHFQHYECSKPLTTHTRAPAAPGGLDFAA